MAKSFSSASLHVSASSLCRLYLPHYSGDSFWMRWPVSWPPFMPYFHGDFDHEDRTSGNRGLLRPGKEQEVLWKENTGGCSFESKQHTAVTMAPWVTIIDICPISVLSHCSSFEILRQGWGREESLLPCPTISLSRRRPHQIQPTDCSKGHFGNSQNEPKVSSN